MPNKPSNQEDFEDELMGPQILVPEKKPYKVFETEIRARQTYFYISEPIGPALHYAEMIHAIRMADEGDEIFIYLNTPGGDTDAGVQIINAIRQTNAHVTTILDASACSMGALIFLCGHSIGLCDHGLLMFHNYSSGLIGKGNEQLAAVTMAAKWFGKLMHDICYPFLSREEIDGVLEGRDIWMESDEIQERLARVQEYRDQLAQAEEQQAAAAAAEPPKEDSPAKPEQKPAKAK